MSILRDEKKQQTKEQILKSAKEIFISEGYTKTTIAKIAKHAHIGIGTFYNYFKSKSEVFLFTFNGHPEELIRNTKFVLDNPSDDLLETILELTNIYLDSYLKIDKKFWQEIVSAFALNVRDNIEAMTEFVEVDMKFVEQLSELIILYKQKGVLSADFDEFAGAQSIYSIFALQILLYIYVEDLPFDIMKNNIVTQIKLYFANKVNNFSHE